MTRYGFAIKALPKGAKPFGEEDDDENQDSPDVEDTSLENAAPDGLDSEPSDDELPPDPSAAPAAPEDPAAGPVDDAPPEGGADGEEAGAAPVQPEDDARPWAGDLYEEGDETSPEDAYCAYTGSGGEQAWLDRAPDGTLTGWVRDGTGQVWRYTDADAWATDVDGAQMTRTHGPDGEDGAAAPTAPGAPAQPGGRGVQDQMFAAQ